MHLPGTDLEKQLAEHSTTPALGSQRRKGGAEIPGERQHPAVEAGWKGKGNKRKRAVLPLLHPSVCLAAACPSGCQPPHPPSPPGGSLE